MRIFNQTNNDFFDTIRAIRNEFAHNLAPITFETPRIEHLCRKLYSIDGIKYLKSINDEALKDYPEMLQLNSLWLGPLVELPNTARNSYMNTIKVILFVVELATSLRLPERTPW